MHFLTFTLMKVNDYKECIPKKKKKKNVSQYNSYDFDRKQILAVQLLNKSFVCS